MSENRPAYLAGSQGEKAEAARSPASGALDHLDAMIRNNHELLLRLRSRLRPIATVQPNTAAGDGPTPGNRIEAAPPIRVVDRLEMAHRCLDANNCFIEQILASLDV